jgi:cytochrome P450
MEDIETLCKTTYLKRGFLVVHSLPLNPIHQHLTNIFAKETRNPMSSIVDSTMSELETLFSFKSDPCGFFVKLLHKGDLVLLNPKSKKPAYVVNSPEFIQEILVNKDSSFRKGRISKVMRRTIGDGLLTSEKNEHHRQRRYVQPAFYKERIEAYARIVVEKTLQLVERIEDGQVVSMDEALMQLTLSVITRTMFATDVEAQKAELANAVNITIEHTARTLMSPFILPMSIPTLGNIKHQRAIRTLEKMVFNVIGEAKRNPERYHMTLLGMMLDTRDEAGTPLPDHEIRDQMMTMLLAGHETTANLLSWVFYLLDREQDALAKLQHEADQTDWTRVSPFEAYRSFQWIPQVMNETLRLYPPAWIINREAEGELELLGENFPADSTFVICPYAIHRNKQVFEDALSFRPERFAGGAEAQWPRFAYFPFGGGGRGCIGSNFAMMEASLILAVLSQSFSFRSLKKKTVKPEPLVSLRIKNGLRMTAHRRKL